MNKQFERYLQITLSLLDLALLNVAYLLCQLILNEKGSGLHQIEGKPIQRLAPGDSVFVGPGVVHWHGAAPDAPLTQVSIGFGGMTKWGDPVSDTAYRGAK